MINNCYIFKDYRINGKEKFSNNFFDKFTSVIDMQEIDFPRYVNLKNNEHHYTYKYAYDFFRKVLSVDYNVEFIQNEWTLKQFIFGSSNLSYMVPKQNIDLLIYDYYDRQNVSGDFSVLRSTTQITPYHYNFRFTHKVSKIHNLSNKNGRRLLINTDSFIVPIIGLLIYYFEYILCLDNRKFIKTKHIINAFNPTDMLTYMVAKDFELKFNANLL